jgi:hypothetical protein
MPLGELETHPYLALGNLSNSTKLILGSFPVYECTDPDNELKQFNRQQEGTVRFFYGSIDSSFWKKYSAYVDNTINLPPNQDVIIQSLRLRQIAISDTFISCERHNYSSEDTKLINKTPNRIGVRNLIQNGVRKILCTSKGVLNTLDKTIICTRKNPIGALNPNLTDDFQTSFIEAIGGSTVNIKTKVVRVFQLNSGTRLMALAVPSPGSPQRRIVEFGIHGQHWQIYANNYFQSAFNWLATD